MMTDRRYEVVRILAGTAPNYFHVFLISMVCGTVLYGCRFLCIKNNVRQEQERQEAAEARRRAMARAAALAAQQQQQVQTRMTTDALVDGMSRSDREAFVKNFLKTDIMTVNRAAIMMAEGDVEEQAAGSMLSVKTMRTTDNSMIRPDSTSVLSDPRPENSPSMLSTLRDASGLWSHGGTEDGASQQRYPQCAICLERLQINEEIGLSQNDACTHVYHKACISEWLLTHKECPICRRKFLDLATI